MSHRHLLTAAMLAAALLALPSAFAQTVPDNVRIIKGPDGVVRIDDQKPDEPKVDEDKKDEPKTDDTKEEKKDPNDITGGIGDSQKVRGRQATTAPSKKGLWEELVDQPWYTPAKRAQQNLFHGQYTKAESLFKDLLKQTPASQEYIEGLAEAILRQGREADIKRFDENVAALTAEQRATPRMTRLRAEALMFRGKYPEAQEL